MRRWCASASRRIPLGFPAHGRDLVVSVPRRGGRASGPAPWVHRPLAPLEAGPCGSRGALRGVRANAVGAQRWTPYPTGMRLKKVADAGDRSSAISTSLASAPPISSVTRWAVRSRSSSPSAAARAASSRSRRAAAGSSVVPSRSGSRGSSRARCEWSASRKQIPRLMRRPGARKLAMRDIMRHGELISPADAVDLSLDPLGCTIVNEVLSSLRAGRGHVEDLDQVAAPTLIAWGELDRILPLATCSVRFKREIPDAEFRVLLGSGTCRCGTTPASSPRRSLTGSRRTSRRRWQGTSR